MTDPFFWLIIGLWVFALLVTSLYTWGIRVGEAILKVTGKIVRWIEGDK